MFPFCLTCFIIGLLCITWLVGFTHCVVIWLARSEPSIHPRNPAVVSLLGILNLTITLIVAFNLFMPLGCSFIMLIAYSILNLHLFPSFFRGIQYIVRSREHFRSKYWYVKSNSAIFKYTIVFSVINYAAMMVFMYNLNSYKNNSCIISWDGIYIGLILVSTTLTTAIIICKIPWQYDGFSLDVELKINFSLWATFGLTALLTEISLNFGASIYHGTPSLLVIGMNICFFCSSIVWPLHMNTAVASTSAKAKSIFLEFLLPNHSNRIHAVDFEVADFRNLDYENPNRKIFGHSSFSSLFNDPSATEQFHDFSRRHLIPETSLFLHEVHKFKESNSNQERYNIFENIVSTFLKPNSPYELENSIVKPDFYDFVLLSKKQQEEYFTQVEERLSIVFLHNYAVKFREQTRFSQ
mmetsp:Transcript_5479/g.7523  ORF Transcript_5479/g.7523 Transcript_5479/m.7523 type:complete len:410 (+) Transcript_5479:122-1351(+)